MFDPAMTRRPAPAVPAHIAAFGSRFGNRVLFSPEPEGEGAGPAKPVDALTRAQFVAEEKARQLDKGVEYLAEKNAGLQFDLNAQRRLAVPDTHVAVSKEDAAALAGYRDIYPTPKAAKDAQDKQVDTDRREEQRAYDEARRTALDAFEGLSDGVKTLIPTAEELLKQPGGEARLKDTAFLVAEVERYGTAYGASKQKTTTETPVGVSPNGVEAPVNKSEGVTDAQEAARKMLKNKYTPDKKE